MATLIDQPETGINRHWLYAVIGGLAAVFALDLHLPAGIALGILHIPVILAATLSRERKLVIGATVIGAIMVVIAFVLQPQVSTVPSLFPVINRILTLVAILITGALGVLLLRYFERYLQAQGELSRNQQLSEMAGMLARFGGWSFNVRSGKLFWSDEVARIHETDPGYLPSLDDAIGFYAPEHRERIAEIFHRCSRDGVPFDEELELVTAKGNRIWVRAAGKAVRGASGKIIEVQGAFQDVSARKQIEESLESVERRFREFADAMPLAVWSAAADGTVDYQNKYVRELTGLTAVELLAPAPAGWLATIHPDDRDRCIAVWTEAVTTAKPYRITFRIQTHDGRYRWHLTQAEPSLDADGSVWKWHGTAIDINEQIQLGMRFERTLESISDAYLAMNREWSVSYVNAQFERATGVRRDNLLGRNVWDFFPDADRFKEHYDNALTTGEPVHFQELYSPLGLWFDVHAYPSADGIDIFFRDITQQRKIEAQLRQSQRLESLGQLTGGVAHDFNNLLTVILGNADLLSEQLAGNHGLQPLAGTISSAAQRGAELTHHLLAFARQQALDPRPTDINQLFDSMKGLLKRTLGENIEVEFINHEIDLPNVLVDAGQLENALLNLCLNARDAMKDGGRLTIETANTCIDENYATQHGDLQSGQYVMLAVSDTGSGIDPQHLSHVFDPFYTTKAKGKGTGLGLAMVYGFIKQSGGHVNIYSEVGQGTTVKLYLPQTQKRVERPSAVQYTNLMGNGEVILLVEDDDMVRKYAHDQLLSLGYQVRVAANGVEALNLIRDGEQIDLLFTDVVMPGGINGRQLADQALQLRPALKILFTSGYTENAIVHHGRLDPGVNLLNKPYRREELARRVQRSLKE
ncbi:MAG: PAS domain-containing protein [Nitrosomonas sp.]|nr:PAS domain-containing protein [Nitrosomonas sp.]